MIGEKVEPVVTRMGLLDMQVCVPAAWTDEEVVAFAEGYYPCGTTNGWKIRREGNPLLLGKPERAQCSQRQDFVHIMLDA